jgi:hypothetical protein
MHKELSKLNNKKNDPVRKWEECLQRHLIKDTHMENTHVEKMLKIISH